MMRREKIRMLLIVSEFSSARIVRREQGEFSNLEFSHATSRGGFSRQVRDNPPDVILFQQDGISGINLSSVLNIAGSRSPKIPVIVLGRDEDEGEDAVGYLDQGADDYVPASSVERLPLVARRLLEERRMRIRQDKMELELQQARDCLMENQKLMTIGRLTGSITHEINNPLESVTNLLYLLKTQPDLSAQAERYLTLAERELERVTHIIRQTLSFYRESNKAVWLKPAELLEEVLLLYGPKLQERHIELVRDFTSDAKLLIFPGELRQVLSNLLANAIEASSSGGKVILRIRNARKWSDEGITGVRIVVADRGSGIDAQTREHLGQLFYTTKGQRGTGLGLWVTMAIVKRYGGDVQLYSSTRNDRHGTVFSIFIPTNMRPQPVLLDGGNDPHVGGDWRRQRRAVVRNDAPHSSSIFGMENPESRAFRGNRKPQVAG
jgi:two-component system NtrC family sensor kinase